MKKKKEKWYIYSKLKKGEIVNMYENLKISKKQLESDMKQYSILSNRTDLSFSESLIAQMERAPEMLDLLNQQNMILLLLNLNNNFEKQMLLNLNCQNFYHFF